MVVTALLKSPNSSIARRQQLGLGGKVRSRLRARLGLSYGLVNSMPTMRCWRRVPGGSPTGWPRRAGPALLEIAPRPSGQSPTSTTSTAHARYDAIKKTPPDAAVPQGVGEDSGRRPSPHPGCGDPGQGLERAAHRPYTFANSRIARMYGLSATMPAAGRPDPFVRVELDPKQRAGLLTRSASWPTTARSRPRLISGGVHIAYDVLASTAAAP